MATSNLALAEEIALVHVFHIHVTAEPTALRETVPNHPLKASLLRR